MKQNFVALFFLLIAVEGFLVKNVPSGSVQKSFYRVAPQGRAPLVFSTTTPPNGDTLADSPVAELSNIAIQVRKNLMSGEMGQRGEIFVAGQFGLLFCILVGGVPLVGDLISFVLGPVLTLAGAVGIGLSLKELGASLSPWPVTAPDCDLVTTGPFQYVRHPIYTSLLAACAGWSLWTGSAMRLLLSAVLAFVLDKKCAAEEESLQLTFGDDYTDYSKKVPRRLIPDLPMPWTMKDMDL